LEGRSGERGNGQWSSGHSRRLPRELLRGLPSRSERKQGRGSLPLESHLTAQRQQRRLGGQTGAWDRRDPPIPNPSLIPAIPDAFDATQGSFGDVPRAAVDGNSSGTHSAALSPRTVLSSSVVTGDRLARTQTLGSTLGPRLRLGDFWQVHDHLLVGNAVEQMPDQV
jgi:hypothetical protein